jgi:hypothetical protein
LLLKCRALLNNLVVAPASNLHHGDDDDNFDRFDSTMVGYMIRHAMYQFFGGLDSHKALRCFIASALWFFSTLVLGTSKRSKSKRGGGQCNHHDHGSW